MKYLFLSFSLFLFSSNLFSQTYQPLVVEDKHWLIGQCGTLGDEIDAFYENLIRGDTTINSVEYKKVYRRDFDTSSSSDPCAIFHGEINKPYQIISQEYIGAIRENIVERKVYYLPADNFLEHNCLENSEEYLLFDFSLDIGNTYIFCRDFNSGGEPYQDTLSLLQIENSSFYGERKKFHYSNEDETTALTIYEGFGTKLGLVRHWSLHFIVDSGYHSVVDFCTGTDEECLFTPDAVKNPIKTKDVKIIPSPSSGRFEVKFESNFSEDTFLQILNGQGVVVDKIAVSRNSVLVDLPLLDGLYFLSVVENGQLIWSGKTVVLR